MTDNPLLAEKGRTEFERNLSMSFIRSDWGVGHRSEGPTPSPLDEAMVAILNAKPTVTRLVSAMPGERDVALHSSEGDAVLSFRHGRVQAALLRFYVGEQAEVWSIRHPEGPVWEALRHFAS